MCQMRDCSEVVDLYCGDMFMFLLHLSFLVVGWDSSSYYWQWVSWYMGNAIIRSQLTHESEFGVN